MKGQLIKQINNLKITVDNNTFVFSVWTPDGKEIYQSKIYEDVVHRCQNCTQYIQNKSKAFYVILWRQEFGEEYWIQATTKETNNTKLLKWFQAEFDKSIDGIDDTMLALLVQITQKEYDMLTKFIKQKKFKEIETLYKAKKFKVIQELSL